MRILIGGMNHESNTLNPIVTGADDFIVFYGNDILTKGLLPSYSSTGIITELQNAGCTLVPTVLARAVPNGVVSEDFYKTHIKAEFVSRTKEALSAGGIDGVCLALHGSMKVENLGGNGESGCAEGDLIAALRELLPDVPFVSALDMHATITPEMLFGIDALVGYKTAPHIDCAQTGAHAARMLLTSLKTGKRLYTSYRRIPMLIAGEKSESEAEPMRTLIEECRDAEAEQSGKIMAASFLLGFPWADAPENSVSVLVSGFEDDSGACDACAEKLAHSFWARRKDFSFRMEHYDSKVSMQKAYETVLQKGEKPVFVSDSGDNPTAGATGDATDLLERILETLEAAEKLPTPLLYSGFFDAPACAACIKAGVGAEVDVTVGGNFDTVNGKKIPLRLKVLKIVRGYAPYDADLVFASYKNIRFTLTSKHIGFGDEGLLPALGVRPEDYCLVVVKLGYLEPCFRTIAARAIMATSKGCSNEVLETIPYKRLRRPIYPLDDM